MIDSKKLITVFLILAVLASASVFIFSNSKPQRTASPLSLLNAARDGNVLPSIGENAFVETLPKTNYPYLDATQPAEDFSAVTKNPGNLTQNLYNLMTREILSANPKGPQVLGGENYLSAPTEEKLSEILTKEAKNFKIKDFENSDLGADIKIAKDYKDEDIFNYLKAVNKIFNETIANNRFVSMVNEGVAKNTSPADSLAFEEAFEILTNGDVAYDEAIERVGLLQVPAPLIPLHKSLVAAIRNPRVYFSIITDYQNDPLKAAVVLQNNNRVKDKIAQGFKNFESELTKIDLNATISGIKNKKAISVEIKKIFGIKIAIAQIFVPIDCLGPQCLVMSASLATIAAATTAETTNDTIRVPLLSAALQFLKNQLVTQMSNQVIRWVQGGGKPRFITDWKGFVLDAANQTTGLVIDRIAPNLCRGLAPLLQISFQPPLSLQTQAGGCTLSQVVRNVTNFYNNFSSQGIQVGWQSYGAIIQPNNNFFGSTILAHDELTAQAAAASKAAETEAKSSGGFFSTKTCPAGTRKVNETLCSDGSTPYTTTPGQAVGNTVATALNAPLHNIVNANDVAGLAAAIANLLINKLVGAAGGLLGV